MSKASHSLAVTHRPKLVHPGPKTALQNETRELLFFSGLSPKAIAARLEVGERIVRDWISGERPIPPARCKELMTVIDELDCERAEAMRKRFSRCLKLALEE